MVKITMGGYGTRIEKEFEEFPDFIEELFKRLTDEQRLQIMSNYCKHCGSDNPQCQCWNDD